MQQKLLSHKYNRVFIASYIQCHVPYSRIFWRAKLANWTCAPHATPLRTVIRAITRVRARVFAKLKSPQKFPAIRYSISCVCFFFVFFFACLFFFCLFVFFLPCLQVASLCDTASEPVCLDQCTGARACNNCIEVNVELLLLGST